MKDEERVQKLREALQYFVDRVEAGSIRSSKTYLYYKRILDETEDKLGEPS